jgi:hypothetical protein
MVTNKNKKYINLFLNYLYIHMNSFDSFVNNNLGWVHENKYVLPVLSLILGVYAALARPKLPKFLEKLFENPIFRLVMISYIIYRGNKDPQLSIMIAAAFLVTMHMINKQKLNNLICGGKKKSRSISKLKKWKSRSISKLKKWKSRSISKLKKKSRSNSKQKIDSVISEGKKKIDSVISKGKKKINSESSQKKRKNLLNFIKDLKF